MAYEKKSKGLKMFRRVAGLSIARNMSVSFTPDELKDIMREIDAKIPRSNPYMVPRYFKDEIQKHPTKA